MLEICSTFAVNSAPPKGWAGQDTMDFVLRKCTMHQVLNYVIFNETNKTFSDYDSGAIVQCNGKCP